MERLVTKAFKLRASLSREVWYMMIDCRKTKLPSKDIMVYGVTMLIIMWSPK